MLKVNDEIKLLNLDKNDFSGYSFDFVENLLSMNNTIEHLSMSNCSVGDIVIDFLGIGLGANTSLKVLNLSHN